MQMFWMDTDPDLVLPDAAVTCAASPYSLPELRAIYWNEVFPAVRFNMWWLPAPEWRGFELDWLAERILKRNRFGRRLPYGWLHRYSQAWWQRLETAIVEIREGR